MWAVADLLTRRPVVSAALLAQELGIEFTNAHHYLNPLTAAGILLQTSNKPWLVEANQRSPGSAGSGETVDRLRCLHCLIAVCRGCCTAHCREHGPVAICATVAILDDALMAGVES